MIGSYFKKLAKQNNMKVKGGVAYGEFRGYAVTFRDGNNTKYISITTRFPSDDEKMAFQDELRQIELFKVYSVREIELFDGRIDITFYDTLGTWKKLLSFIDYFFPLLDRCGASKAYTCIKCNELITNGGTWRLINNAAYHMHNDCGIEACCEIERAMQEPAEPEGGSFFTGALGALCGALIGAVPVAALRYFGYPGYLFGALIGFLAYKGYMLANGKKAKGKGIIVILCAIVGILLGTLSSEAIYMIIAINNGQLSPMAGKDVVPGLFYLLATNEEFANDCDVSIMLGLIMAIAGMFPIFKNKRRKKSKVITLE